MKNHGNTDTIERVTNILETRKEVAPPSMWQAVLVNDNTTPFEFVIYTLMEIFSKNMREAAEVMMEAHSKGSALVLVSTRDVIESKVTQANATSSQQGLELRYTAEKAP